MILTYFSLRMRIVVEGRVLTLDIPLVVHIHALIRPFLGNPGQLVVPDLINIEKSEKYVIIR